MLYITPKYHRGANPESGFAIGLILLAVVLMAAIVGAIAVSTQNAGSSANMEQTRITVMSTIQQAITIESAASRYLSLGLSTGNQVLGQDKGTDNTFLGLLVDKGFLGEVPVAPSTILVTGGRWDIRAPTGGPFAGKNITWLLLPVTEQACQQFNSILWKTGLNIPLPAVTLGDIIAGKISVDGTLRSEGCGKSATVIYYIKFL